jgi:serine/threonine protein kinase
MRAKAAAKAPARAPSPGAKGRPRSSTGTPSASTAAKSSAKPGSKSGASSLPGSSSLSKKGSSSAANAALGTVGPYTKLKAVGKGSFGQIWLVRHTQKGGEPLVLKEMRLTKLSASEVKAQKQEIDVLKRLSHPSIVGFVSTFEETGMVGLLLEYAAGGDLDTAIAKRVKDGKVRFPESVLTALATQLASALSYLHEEAKMIHRDVKPANVFLTSTDDVRLGDFGLCAALSEVSEGRSSEPVGTPLYMSPELLAGKQTADGAADVWALGCVLYEAMSLQSPWSELEDGHGGIEGGMAGLRKRVSAPPLARSLSHARRVSSPLRLSPPLPSLPCPAFLPPPPAPPSLRLPPLPPSLRVACSCTDDNARARAARQVTTATLDTDSLKVANGGNFPAALCDATAQLLAKEPTKRLPLKRLVDQLTEKPAIPASWGLSAEAAAALAGVEIS